LVSCLKRAFLYQGQWYRWQNQRRGVPTHDFGPRQAICYLQNHDQIGNTLRGERITRLANRHSVHALTAAMFLGPQTPMLFMGQEFDARSPFPFFCDHKPALAKIVNKGRRRFLSQFPSYARASRYIPTPQSPSTFRSTKLNWNEVRLNRSALRLHRDILWLRANDPTFSTSEMHDGAVLGSRAFVFRRFGASQDDRLVVTNIGPTVLKTPCGEPLLAPPAGRRWKLMWASDQHRYGGSNTSTRWDDVSWVLPGRTTMVFKPVRK
jgi:maltooligosyltrehalose trehalohydrolase